MIATDKVRYSVMRGGQKGMRKGGNTAGGNTNQDER